MKRIRGWNVTQYTHSLVQHTIVYVCVYGVSLCVRTSRQFFHHSLCVNEMSNFFPGPNKLFSVWHGSLEEKESECSNGICLGWIFSLHISNSKMLSDEVIYDVLRHLCVCKHSAPIPLTLVCVYISICRLQQAKSKREREVEGEKRQTTQIGTH